MPVPPRAFRLSATAFVFGLVALVAPGTAATADAYGMECHLLSPDEAAERYPLLEIDDLLGAIWLPGDGKANPTDLTASLARGARQGGARILEGVRVTGVRVEHGRATGVETDAGAIEAFLAQH